MTLPVKLTDLLVTSQHTIVDLSFFNQKFSLLFNGLDNLDARMTVYDAQVANLVSTGLDRLNTALGPMLITLQTAAQLGFLQCESVGTHISLVEGEAEGFVVTAGAALFTPTPFLMAQDKNDSTNWGILSLDAGGWTPSTGDLATHCVYASKTLSSTDWVISASAGVLPAMQDMLASAQAAANSASASQATIAADIVTLNSLIAAVASGPVASVAGRTGVVTLAIADISGLITALANKVESSVYTPGLAGKQPSSSKLTAIDAASWAANQLLMATGAGSLTMLNISAAMQTLLNSATNAALLAAIGGVDNPTMTSAISASASSLTSSIPVKAASSDLTTGTDDTKFATALGLKSVYSKRTFEFAAVQAASFTLGSTFNGQVIPWTGGSAGTITLANNAPIGTECMIDCEGAGTITFAAQSGGTVQSRGARLKSNGQYSQITAYVYTNGSGTNAAWRLGGDLST